jgi:hypothetical protein
MQPEWGGWGRRQGQGTSVEKALGGPDIVENWRRAMRSGDEPGEGRQCDLGRVVLGRDKLRAPRAGS